MLLSKHYLLTLIALSGCSGLSAFASDVTSCETKYLDILQKYDQDGYEIWDMLSESSKETARQFIECDSMGNIIYPGPGTLVHEALHLLDVGKGAGSSPIISPGSGTPVHGAQHSLAVGAGSRPSFWLPSGEWITYKSKSEDGEYDYARGQALKVMSEDERKLSRTSTYLHEHGAQDFLTLLEELNAYNHGLRTVIRMPPVPGSVVNEREGPLEMVLFVLRYLEAMKKQQPAYYTKRILADSQMMAVIKTLIRNAYEVSNTGCTREDLTMDGKRVISGLGNPASQSMLGLLFGNDIPSLDVQCEKTVSFGATRAAVPTTFPRRRSSSIKSGTGSVSNATVRIGIPENKLHDPKKASYLEISVKRIDDQKLKMWTTFGNHKIEWMVSADGSADTILWNGKKITEEDFQKKCASNFLFNSRYVNRKYTEVK